VGVISRAAALATIPLGTGARMAGAATRSALGANRQAVYDAATAASIDAAVATLSRIKGPAMKFGQSLAVFSGVLPDHLAEKFRALEQLYESAEPEPFAKLAPLLVVVPSGALQVESTAVAAASLGQVHRGVWTDPVSGKQTDVAVKLRYPNARRNAKSDMAQLRALLPLISRLLPNLDLRALLDEHGERLIEELDYRNEAAWMGRFAAAWADHDVHVPAVLFASESVLVTEWMDGTPLADLIAAGNATNDASSREAERDRAGELLARFCLGSVSLVGAMHADPHPGNYRLLADGRLGVLDFGSVAHAPGSQGVGAFTRMFVLTSYLAHHQYWTLLRHVWVEAGMATEDVTEDALVDVLDIDRTGQRPTPYDEGVFHFDPSWIAPSSEKWANPGAAIEGARVIRFPPAYLLEHRAVMGMFALLTALRAHVPMRDILDETLADLGALDGLVLDSDLQAG
jgi:predicted unusual protein kinase regulating ubiquinone biosynthesis (AarF/ABC1/UbiB family)